MSSMSGKNTNNNDQASTSTGTSYTEPHNHHALPDDDLPSNVCHEHQLAQLPPECLSDPDLYPHRPLRHMDDRGDEYHYALNPIMYSVVWILMVELLERFCFYGIYYTQTLYLTGVYNQEWNAGLSSVNAASFVSLGTAVAYTTPFLGGLCADQWLGDYNSIVAGSIGMYLPGLIVIALTTIPHIGGLEEFPTTALAVAILVLWPLGTGMIKSIINVFGAKQFHPLLQSSLIQSYYVNFYMAINVGALAGNIILPIVAQFHVTQAYFIAVVLLAVGIALFVSATPHYVLSKPRGELWSKKKKTKTNNRYNNPYDGQQPNLLTIFRIALLIVPFAIAYNQMPTTFELQGTVMRKAFGYLDAATMNSLDALSVLFFGFITGNFMYPALAKRNIKIPTTYKFAIGSALGACAILWALFVEHKIHAAYQAAQVDDTLDPHISILWLSPAYIFIGFGEIFAISSAYEVAFTASAPEQKVLASAVNIFCVGGIPNLICIALYQGCQGWFRNARGTTSLQRLEDYATANVANYYWVLMGILAFGIFINSLPFIRDFVQSTEQAAADLVRTPQLRKSLGKSGGGMDEESPLLPGTPCTQAHQKYLKYGKGPVLYKMGSMRAGPSLADKEAVKNKKIPMKNISKLYSRASGVAHGVVVGRDGPVKAGDLQKKGGHRQESM